MRHLIPLFALACLLAAACGSHPVPVADDEPSCPDDGGCRTYTVADAHAVYYVNLDGGAGD